MTAAPVSSPTSGPSNAASSPHATAGVATGGNQGGFVDLINLLLGLDEPSAQTDLSSQQKPAAEFDQAQSPDIRSPHEIAVALIKAMTSRDRTSVSSNMYSDSAPKPAGRRQRESNRDPLADVIFQAAASVIPPNLQSSQVDGQMQTSRQDIVLRAQFRSDADNPTRVAPLALSLKLTPKESAGYTSDTMAPNDRPSATATTKDSISELDAALRAGASSTVIAANPESDMQAPDTEALKARFLQEESALNPTGSQIPQMGALHSAPAAPGIPQSVTSVPARTAADALRSAAPDAPTSSPQSSPAQEIAVRITRPDTAVDVHVAERAGQVHVAVRTPDIGLQSSLRQDLGSLVNSLEKAGFHTYAAASHNPISAQASSNMNSNSGQSRDSHDGSGRHPGGQPSEQQQQREPERNSQDWIEAMENAE